MGGGNIALDRTSTTPGVNPETSDEGQSVPNDHDVSPHEMSELHDDE